VEIRGKLRGLLADAVLEFLMEEAWPVRGIRLPFRRAEAGSGDSAMELFPTLAGIAVALGGPALLASPLHRLLGDEDALRTRVCDQFCLLALAAAIIGSVLYWEARPLASIGWRGVSPDSVAWGMGLAAFCMWVIHPVLARLLARLRLGGFEAGLERLSRLPVWFLVFAAVTAGIAEEVLFRGYALTRLAELTGSAAVAGVVTLGVFALAHLRLWGWGPVVSFVVSGAVLTVFFLWQQDLLANILGHTITDVVGLLALTRRRRGAAGGTRR
jgi:membrane protease YdiL (CAAX protease family)